MGSCCTISSIYILDSIVEVTGLSDLPFCDRSHLIRPLYRMPSWLAPFDALLARELDWTELTFSISKWWTVWGAADLITNLVCHQW